MKYFVADPQPKESLCLLEFCCISHSPLFINMISANDFFFYQTMCQDMADEAGSEDEGEAEHDEMLIEYAGEVVPSLGKAMNQTEFAAQFAQLLPLFANKTVSICVQMM